jgi:hypothetical protein
MKAKSLIHLEEEKQFKTATSALDQLGIQYTLVDSNSPGGIQPSLPDINPIQFVQGLITFIVAGLIFLGFIYLTCSPIRHPAINAATKLPDKEPQERVQMVP